MECNNPLGVRADIARHLQDTHRGRIAVNLGIAFVREDLEIMSFRQRNQIGPIPMIGHGPLRIGG